MYVLQFLISILRFSFFLIYIMMIFPMLYHTPLFPTIFFSEFKMNGVIDYPDLHKRETKEKDNLS